MRGIFDVRAHADEHLGDVGTDFPGVFADLGMVEGHLTPAQNFQAFSFDGLFNQAAAVGVDFRWHESHADTVFATEWKTDSERSGFALKQLYGRLDEHACAVAGFRVSPGGATVSQVDQHLHTFVDDLVRLLTLDIGDNAYAASIVFLLGRIKSFFS